MKKLLLAASLVLATQAYGSDEQQRRQRVLAEANPTTLAAEMISMEVRTIAGLEALDEVGSLQLLAGLRGKGQFADQVCSLSKTDRQSIEETLLKKLGLKENTAEEILNKEMAVSAMTNFGLFVGNLSQLTGAVLVQDGDLMWYNTGLGHGMFNYAYTDQPILEEGLGFMLKEYRTTPFYFCTGLKETTQESQKVLEEAGLVSCGGLEGMFYDLKWEFRPDLPRTDWDIRLVQNEEDYRLFAKVMAEAAGQDHELGLKFFNDYQRYETSDFYAYLACDGVRPVGCSMLMRTEGLVAGNYFDWVLPEYRRRGVDSAMIQHRLLSARALHQRFIVVQCMTTSARLYEKHGFKKVSEMGLYTLPAPAKE